MTDNIRDKTRAVFLAAIMVLSMVAMSATFAGAAAAQNVDIDLDDDEVEVTSFDFDDETVENALLSEEVRYTDNFDDSNNVGPVMGLPVQTGFYDEDEESPSGINFADDGEFQVTNDQTAEATVGFDANVTDETLQIIHDIDDVNDAGLDVTEDTEVTLPSDSDDAFFEALQDATDTTLQTDQTVTVEFLNDLINDETGVSGEFVSVNNDAGEVIINLPPSIFGDEDISTELGVGLNLEVSDQVEGVDLEDSFEDLAVIAEGNAGSAEADTFLFFESGVTGLTPDDAENWENTEEIDARIDFNNDDNAGDDGAVGQFVGSQITVQTPPGDTVEVYEAVRESDGDNYTLGDRVWNEDTSPSNAQAIDTSELGEGEYFIGFEERDDFDENEYIFLDLRPLNMNVSSEDPWTEEETIEIDVETDETDAIRDTGDVQLWVSEEGDDEIADVIHVDRQNLLGVTGDTSFDVDPEDDLDGQGDYTAVALHEDSGIVAETDFSVIEPEDENVEIISPADDDDPYDRGDIFEVEAELENTERATITLGDREEQNVEINVTVRDTDESGDVSFLVNTFQIGDGPVDGQDDDFTTADHGIRAVDDGTAISNIEAHEAMEIGGGSASTNHAANVRDRVVIADGTYDIVASPGRSSHKADDSFSTDRSIFRLNQGEVDDLELWNSPFPGDRRAIAGADKVDAIFDGIDEGIVNPQDARMADNDVLVMGVQAEGLEGFLLNALEVTEEDEGLESDVIEDFLDREDDHYVTEAFDAVASGNVEGYAVGDDAFGFSTNQTDADLADREEERNIRGLDPASLALEEEEILASADDRGTLNEYFVTIQVEEDNIIEPNEREDVAKPLPAEWNTTFNLDVEIADGSATEFPLNDFFGDDVIQTTEWTLYDDEIELDGLEERDDEDILSVPASNHTISGETEVAAGTQINSQTQTASGEDPPFFYPNSFTVEYVEDAPNTIEFAEDFENFAGADFSVNLRRARTAGALAEVDGEVRETPVVNEHVFNDQERGGETVIVENVSVNQRGAIQIQNADGDVLGSQQISEGVTENSRILLDEPIESQEIDSVIVDRDGEEFVEGDVRQSAQYTVSGDADAINAFFDVDDLDPRTATVEPEDELTVSATVENVEGAADNTQTIEFRLDGETVDSQELTLEPDETETVSFDVTAPEEEGTYQHAIASQDTRDRGTLTVAEEDEPADDTADDADDTADDDDDADDDGAGFGIAAALIALLGAALLAYRRQVE